jgi:hypothetical protein
MKVRDASPGQMLYADGRVPKVYTANMREEDLDLCRAAGFLPGFLMPVWIKNRDEEIAPAPLFYIGPIYLSSAVCGLKKHHIFLYEGKTVGIEGYDFRHLQPLESM